MGIPAVVFGIVKPSCNIICAVRLSVQLPVRTCSSECNGCTFRVIDVITGNCRMVVIQRIDDIMKERGWSYYKLSIESGLSSSTITNIYRRNTVPSITTLEAICNAFGITLSQFFAEEEDFVQLSPEQKEMFDNWLCLSENQKKVAEIIEEFKKA